jgi:hypothetical protein
MNRLLILLALLLFSKTSFAQKPRDTMVTNVPTIHDRILYTDSLTVNNRSKHELDSMARNWCTGYFYDRLFEKDTLNSVYCRGVIAYKVKPGMINIDYVAWITVLVTCTDNKYKYQIYNIRFRPKSDALNNIGYQKDPEFLIKAYKQKHLSFGTYWNVTRGQIRDYISKMDIAVKQCIASLNKAMANQ